MDQLHAVGQGALSLFNAAILLTIVAVVLSNRSGAANIISQAFALLSWLVEQVVRPVTPGHDVALTNKLAPAFGSGSGSSSTSSSGGTSGGTNFIDTGSSWDTGTSSGSGGTTLPGDIPTMIINPGR